LSIQNDQGPPGDTRQTIVTLHDDAEGHAAGWNPPFNIFPIRIKVPLELTPEISVEATYVNEPIGVNPQSAGPCELTEVNTETDTIGLVGCSGGTGPVPEEGAILIS
jgi:hypothetical protein